MSFAASARVGAGGHVYSTELDEKKLAHFQEEVNRRKLRNVSIIKGDPSGTNLPDDCCEAVFMRHVYHHFEKAQQTDAAIFRALKPGGLLAIIDFPPNRGLKCDVAAQRDSEEPRWTRRTEKDFDSGVSLCRL